MSPVSIAPTRNVSRADHANSQRGEGGREGGRERQLHCSCARLVYYRTRWFRCRTKVRSPLFIPVSRLLSAALQLFHNYLHWQRAFVGCKYWGMCCSLGVCIGARVVLLLPLSDAQVAAELVAVRAFFRVFDHHQADRAREVLVKTGNSLLWIQVLVSLVLTIQSLFERR
mgnify:CR=1 FL=1